MNVFFIVYVGVIQYVEVSTHRGRIKTEEKGKGRRCCLGDWNDSIPCRASYFAQGWFEEGMNSSHSSYRPGANHPILHIVLVQLILFFRSSWCKIASAAKKWSNFVQAAATTFPFTSFFIHLLCLYWSSVYRYLNLSRKMPEEWPGTSANNTHNHQGEERVQVVPIQFTIGLNRTLLLGTTGIKIELN